MTSMTARRLTPSAPVCPSWCTAIHERTDTYDGVTHSAVIREQTLTTHLDHAGVRFLVEQVDNAAPTIALVLLGADGEPKGFVDLDPEVDAWGLIQGINDASIVATSKAA